jgi:hypothetical protein
MKPTQHGFLTHYPTNGPLIHNGNSWIPEAVVTGGNDKRFTDAELAAEWHRTASMEFAAIGTPSEYKPGAQQRAAIQRMALHRFATHPHYDVVENLLKSIATY